MKDILILDEASFDPALGRPAKAIIAVDSIVSVQECMFTEFVDMDKEERIVGSVIAAATLMLIWSAAKVLGRMMPIATPTRISTSSGGSQR